MSFSFIQSTQKDTFGTSIIALCLTSRFVSVSSTDDLLRFTILSSIITLIIHVFFYVFRLIIFFLLDKRKGYIGRGKFGYAWDHIEFRSYRQNLVFYYKLTIGLIILIIPDYLFIDRNYSNEPFFFQNQYSTNLFLPVVYLILFFVLCIDIYLTRPFYKRLCILRVFNALDNWNQTTRQLIREESWEEVYDKMEKINEKTLQKLMTIKNYIEDKKVKNFYDNYASILSFFYDAKNYDWRREIKRPSNQINLKEITDFLITFS